MADANPRRASGAAADRGGRDESTRVLLLEDNAGDARLVEEHLKRTRGPGFIVEHAARLEDGLAHLRATTFDVVLLDLGLPDSRGLATLAAVGEAAPGLPAVVLTGSDDEAMAMEASRAGAQDYLVKGDLSGELLVRALRYAVERKRAEGQLKRSISLLQSTLDSTADGILVVDTRGAIESFNQRFVDIWGIPDDVLATREDDRVVAHAIRQLKDPDRFQRKVRELYAKPEAESFDVIEFRDGRMIERYSRPQIMDGEVVGRVWSFRDVTERKRAEAAMHASNEKLRALIESAPTPIIALDPHGHVMTWNPAAERVFGWTEAEVLGEPLPFVPEEAIEEHGEMRDRVLQDEMIHGEEARRVRKDGTELTVHVTAAPMRSHSGAIVGIMAVVEDVTERKRAEDALRETTRTLEALVEASPEPIIAHDRDVRVTMWNPAAERVFGWSSDEIMGEPYPIASGDNWEEHMELLDRVMGGEALRGIETRRRRRDGEPVDVSIATAPMQGPGGEVEGIMAVVSDITERKRAEERLIALKNFSQDLLENVPAGIAYLNPEGVLTFENRYLLELMGAREDQTPRGWFEPLFELPNLKGRPEFLAHVRRLLDTGEAFTEHQFSHTSLYGEDIHIAVSGVPVTKQDGDLSGAILLVRDVTEEHKLSEKLRRHAEELERVVAERTAALREANRELERAKLDLETIYESTIDGFLLVDGDMNLVSANQRFCELFGLPLEDVLHGDPEAVRRTARACYRDPAVFDRTLELYAPRNRHVVYNAEIEVANPRPRVIHEHSEPIFDPTGAYVGRVWTYRDITEKKRLERKLEGRSRLLQSIMDNTAEGVFALDPEGHYVFCNRTHRDLMGLDRDVPVVGEALGAGETVHAAVESALDGERVGGLEAPLTNQRGDELHLLWNLEPIHEDGEVTQVVGTVADFTERKRLEDELIRYTRHLEAEVERRSLKLVQSAKMAALGQLVAGVAHEINNPLASVSSNTATLAEVAEALGEEPLVRDALQGHPVDGEALARFFRESGEGAFLLETVPRLLDVNLKGLKRIGAIVENLGGFARPRTNRQAVDLNATLQDTVAIFSAQFRDHVVLETRFGNVPPVHCDAGQVNQVVMNTLVNAAQAVSAGGLVRLTTRREGSTVVITVEDDGPGMPPEVQRRIFDPFYTTREGVGLGLGLSISYNIVKEHGGDIAVESAPGEGTAFRIQLPLETEEDNE